MKGTDARCASSFPIVDLPDPHTPMTNKNVGSFGCMKLNASYEFPCNKNDISQLYISVFFEFWENLIVLELICVMIKPYSELSKV